MSSTAPILRKSESEAILRSLSSGVTPSVGLHHIVVGRKTETAQLISELSTVQEGGGGCKIISGGFGTGKTFLLSFTSYLAMRKGFVISQVDFQPNRALYGSGRGIATYTEFAERLSTRTEPNGQALSRILERWLAKFQHDTLAELSLETVDYTNDAFVTRVQNRVRSVFAEVEGLTGGFDFAEALNAYFRGFTSGDSELQRAALKWLRGEVKTRNEAKSSLGINSIINDENWYDFVKLWAKFVTLIGYAGLVVLFDECVNLYKISSPVTRQKNYEMILRLFNDATQGRLENLYVVFGATPELVEDTRRGLYSYPALKTRLSSNPYESLDYVDLSQPVIRLKLLIPEELAALLWRVRDIHANHYGYSAYLSDDDIVSFVEGFLNRPGAKEYGTVRDCVRNFIGALNIIQQNPGMEKASIFRTQMIKDSPPDILDEFESYDER